MPEPKFAGKEMKLGDRVFTVPPISFKKLKLLQSRIAKLDIKATPGELSPEALDTIVDMTLAAVQRNYPDVTRDELEELIDLGNVMELMEVVAGQSGLVAKGEAGPGLAGSP